MTFQEVKAEAEANRLAFLEKTTGKITFYVRLDPTVVEGAVWRKCTSAEYFFVKYTKKHYGGFMQTKATCEGEAV
jgi:hypothetical protein